MNLVLYYISDIDECSLGTSGCTQNCTNNIGSFTCSCNTGYALASDNKTCNGELDQKVSLIEFGLHFRSRYQ